MVGVYFDVLVGDLFLFQDCPGALDERAEPAREEFQGLGGLVGLYDGCGGSGGVGEEVGVGVLGFGGHSGGWALESVLARFWYSDRHG